MVLLYTPEYSAKEIFERIELKDIETFAKTVESIEVLPYALTPEEVENRYNNNRNT